MQALISTRPPILLRDSPSTGGGRIPLLTRAGGFQLIIKRHGFAMTRRSYSFIRARVTDTQRSVWSV